MDTIFSGNLSARILLTILTAGYGIIPALADLNKTHAKNLLWTPHARFHVVWQVCSYVGLALIGLGLIWIRGPVYVERLYLAASFAAVVHGGFFLALFTMSIYGGKTYDENGYRPFLVRFLGRERSWDLNVVLLTIATVLLIAAVSLISSSRQISTP
jgi:hypothetical protein